MSGADINGHQLQTPLPPHAKVVICGGGIIGNSIAYHLSQKGLNDILLLDKGRFVVILRLPSEHLILTTTSSYSIEHIAKSIITDKDLILSFYKSPQLFHSSHGLFK